MFANVIDTGVHLADFALEYAQVPVQLLDSLLLKLRKPGQFLQSSAWCGGPFFPGSLWQGSQIVALVLHISLQYMMDLVAAVMIRPWLGLELDKRWALPFLHLVGSFSFGLI